MRSIRLSLIAYFLGLLAVALTVASLFIYTMAQRTLISKEQAARDLAEVRYDEDAREARQRLDDQLLAQARALAGRVRPRYRWDRINDHHYRLNILGCLSTHLGPCPQYGSLLNLMQGPQCYWDNVNGKWATSPLPKQASKNPRGKAPRYWPGVHPTQYHLWKHDLIDLAFGREVEVIVPEDAGWPRSTYRIETNYWGRPLLPSGPQAVTLPDERDFAQTDRLTWILDDYRAESGTHARRVRFRSRITLQESTPNQTYPWGRGGYRTQSASIIVQCAADTRELDVVLNDLAKKRDRELAALESETNTTLAQYRSRLLIICGFTFGATILGSFVLVWRGLSPLARLSDAVSKVSHRNFRLEMDESRLPQELRPIAATLSTTLDQLQRAFAREKQATADISHELRTPLAALLMNIDLGLRKVRSPEQYREIFEDCKLSAQQMHQIIERLLTLARLDAGVDRLRAQPVDVVELAGQCAAVVRPLAEARGLALTVNDQRPGPDSTSEEASPSVLTDPDKLREIVTNLLHNAVQYNRPEGRIDLTVNGDGERVVLEVRDTGIGISAEVRENIFERFYRADPSRNADDLHAGLGLAIVKEYVGLMGGRITVDSQVGEGSTFRVELPVQPPA